MMTAESGEQTNMKTRHSDKLDPASRGESPRAGPRLLILSQDYELFFQHSGTVEKCLFEPCEALLRSARKTGYAITFYVDAGMLCRMERLAGAQPSLGRELDRVRRHVEMLARAGHDIGLHIHPHWEDTTFRDGQWGFEGTRYQLGQFPDDDAAEIVSRYARTLAEISGVETTSYRAGGFCVEPFDRISSALLRAGIDVDSSVVPGARLKNAVKGFDFRNVPSADWWQFEDSPTMEARNGRFLEIPISPLSLPVMYYWRRVLSRATSGTSGQSAQHFGDGTAKPVGRREVFRRLSGRSCIAEASIDDPKAFELRRGAAAMSGRRIWHIMGHPKNISHKSLLCFENAIRENKLEAFATVAGAAKLIRAGQLT